MCKISSLLTCTKIHFVCRCVSVRSYLNVYAYCILIASMFFFLTIWKFKKINEPIVDTYMLFRTNCFFVNKSHNIDLLNINIIICSYIVIFILGVDTIYFLNCFIIIFNVYYTINNNFFSFIWMYYQNIV